MDTWRSRLPWIIAAVAAGVLAGGDLASWLAYGHILPEPIHSTLGRISGTSVTVGVVLYGMRRSRTDGYLARIRDERAHQQTRAERDDQDERTDTRRIHGEREG